MKLKKVAPVAQDLPKCCRWCHHYENGRCYCKDTVTIEQDDLKVYKVVEEGHLDEVLQETLGSVPLEEFRELEYLLRGYKLSEKRIKEFDDLLRKCWESFSNDTLRPQLEENVFRCFKSHIHDEAEPTEGVYIFNPEEYCCSEWR